MSITNLYPLSFDDRTKAWILSLLFSAIRDIAMMLAEPPSLSRPGGAYPTRISQLSKDSIAPVWTRVQSRLYMPIQNVEIMAQVAVRTQNKPIQKSLLRNNNESTSSPKPSDRGLRLEDLPVEIQEGVLDVLVGSLASTSSSAMERNHGMRNWGNAMRHPRRRQLSDLALVSKKWRRMVQERLYRHGETKMEPTNGVIY